MNYMNITKDDMKNGEGIRVVLWVAGCTHHCPGCQNPSTWDAGGGLPFDDGALFELEEQLREEYISGITFSGGDPLFPGNREAITSIAKWVKETFPQKNIWCYTGYRYEEIENLPVLQYIDVLVDGRYEQAKRDVTIPWRGSTNQRVLRLGNGKIAEVLFPNEKSL